MFTRYESTKPLFYSVDVFFSLKQGEFVAVSAFPITATQVNNQPKVKPYATGTTVDNASANLAKAITNVTGTKNLAIISIRHYNTYLCVDCRSMLTFEKRTDLVEHRQLRHHTVSETAYQQSSDKPLILP